MKQEITKDYHIPASADKLWEALTDPAIVKQYFFGTDMKADWRVGGEITYTGEWEGKSYTDKGKILAIEPGKSMLINYWSNLSGKPDVPENYNRFSYTLNPAHDGHTNLTIMQEVEDASKVESAWQHWDMTMKGLKKVIGDGTE